MKNDYKTIFAVRIKKKSHLAKIYIFIMCLVALIGLPSVFIILLNLFFKR